MQVMDPSALVEVTRNTGKKDVVFSNTARRSTTVDLFKILDLLTLRALHGHDRLLILFLDSLWHDIVFRS